MVVQTPCDRQCGTASVEIWFLVMGGRVDIAVLLRRSRDGYLLSSNGTGMMAVSWCSRDDPRSTENGVTVAHEERLTARTPGTGCDVEQYREAADDVDGEGGRLPVAILCV